MIRLGVLGAGGHSTSNHGPALRRCQQENPAGVELAAVCDLDGDKASVYAREFGFRRVYTDLQQMVRQERLDGIVAITALPQTVDLATAVARLGIPLVIEKPPGETTPETVRLLAAVRASGTPHMISFNRRFSPAIARAREWLQDRPPPQLALSRMLRQSRRDERFAFGTGIHAVDTVVAFMGQPASVTAHRREVGPQRTEMYDASVVFEAGGDALICLAPTAGNVEETLELIGPDYDIQVDVKSCAIAIRQHNQLVLEWRAPADMPGWEVAGALDETRAFIRYLETGSGWWPGLDEALWSSALSEAIQRGHEGAVTW
jgi:myo-inositol 2-dehydrogenase / D-chiro-inositol 1-dehydrogenase